MAFISPPQGTAVSQTTSLKGRKPAGRKKRTVRNCGLSGSPDFSAWTFGGKGVEELRGKKSNLLCLV